MHLNSKVCLNWKFWRAHFSNFVQYRSLSIFWVPSVSKPSTHIYQQNILFQSSNIMLTCLPAHTQAQSLIHVPSFMQVDLLQGNSLHLSLRRPFAALQQCTAVQHHSTTMPVLPRCQTSDVATTWIFNVLSTAQVSGFCNHHINLLSHAF